MHVPVTIGTSRERVTDQTTLTTTLFEIGPGLDSHQLTGKTLVLPNALFLTQAIINENNSRNYILHSFSIKTKQVKNIAELESILQAKMEELTHEYVKPALSHIKKTFTGKEVDKNTCDPRIVFSQVDAETMKLTLRYPTIAAKIGQAEQELMKTYINWTKEVAERESEKEKDK